MAQRSREAGWTLLDLLVIVISGAVLAIWVSSYFPKNWQTLIGGVLAPILGFGFWFFLFVLLLPLIEHHWKPQSRPDDDNNSP